MVFFLHNSFESKKKCWKLRASCSIDISAILSFVVRLVCKCRENLRYCQIAEYHAEQAFAWYYLQFSWKLLFIWKWLGNDLDGKKIIPLFPAGISKVQILLGVCLVSSLCFVQFKVDSSIVNNSYLVLLCIGLCILNF